VQHPKLDLVVFSASGEVILSRVDQLWIIIGIGIRSPLVHRHGAAWAILADHGPEDPVNEDHVGR